MKILHIITKLEIGGAQFNTLYSVEHQNKQKNTSSEIVAGPIVNKDKNLMPEAKKRKIKVTIIKGITNTINPIKNTIALIQTYRYIKKHNFQIVHTHSSVAGIIGRIAAKLAKTKVIIHTVHGWGIRSDLPKWKLQLYLTLERACAKFTDKLIVVSKYNIDKGLKYKIGKKSKYTVIYSGIDIKKFSKKINIQKKKQQLKLSNNPVIGMIGRLDDQKNPLDFVRVASIVQKKHPNTQFIIVGDGPLKNQTKSLVKRLNVKNFHLFGFRDDVDEILQIIEIFVLTSLWEGLPRVFLESMAAGKPIVANNVDGAPEAITNNGYILPPKAPKLMAQKIACLLNNPKAAIQMGKQGKQLVKKFSVNKMLKDIDNLYSSFK